mgnify:FL=1|tara:strand:+ start:6943 stop:7164 length:222 start_codon:yes stop_codon:yes gene_type:complete
MTNENRINELEIQVEKMDKRIKDLDGYIDTLEEAMAPAHKLAQAVAELQDEMMKHHGIYLMNKIHAPTMVGRS